MTTTVDLLIETAKTTGFQGRNRMKFFTLGYEGLEIGKFLEILHEAGVGVVIDVREYAFSKKTDFAKTALRAHLEGIGIEYRHHKEAGNPQENRKTAKTRQECLENYRGYLLRNSKCLNNLLLSVRFHGGNGRKACLICYEHDPLHCHRSILVENLLDRDPSLECIHLG